MWVGPGMIGRNSKAGGKGILSRGNGMEGDLEAVFVSSVLSSESNE